MSEFSFFAYSDFQYQSNSTKSFLSLPIKPYYSTERSHAAYLAGDDAADLDSLTPELNIPYTVFEILVAIFAVIGNLMVIIVFQRERKLRRRTNYYIVSLAIADFLVGSLGVPFAILASIGLPRNLYACLFTVSLLVVLCTISIFCLVAVSVDRYWAILYPMAYSRNVRTKTAIVIISLCWLAGTVVGFLPLFGWHADVADNQQCLFTEVMDYDYLVFLYFATIITPALLMLAFYAHIYKVIIKQVRQIVTMNPVGDCSRRSSTAQIHTPAVSSSSRSCHGGTMLRVLGASRKRDVKATQNLSIIVLFFMICWFPLYTINCIKAFCANCEIHPKLTLFCIILSHMNSAGNPVLYAYHLKDFRAALKNLILKFMGVDIEPPMDPGHRFSLASQHRLQSMDANMRHSLQPRIYIDSPIWLRQQQQQSVKNSQLLAKCSSGGIVSPCLNNINQTVAAVASATTDIERNMWNIMEASSGAELGAEVSYEFPGDESARQSQSQTSSVDSPGGATDSIAPTPPPRHKRPSQRASDPYSYDNRNFTRDIEANHSTDEPNDFEEVFLPNKQAMGAVDPKQLHQSLLKCKMLEKLRTDEANDYQQHHLHHHHRHGTLTESDSELCRGSTSECCTPPQSLASQTLVAAAASTAIYVIDDRLPLSPSMAPRKYRKAHQMRSLGRSCSCTSESPSPGTPKGRLAEIGRQSSVQSGSNSSSRNSLNAVVVMGNGHNGNNNLQTVGNLNYTISPKQSTTPLPEKFSPLRAVSRIIFPPIVKHSSLFQLFQPNAAAAGEQMSPPQSAQSPKTRTAKCDGNGDTITESTTCTTEMQPEEPTQTSTIVEAKPSLITQVDT